jgi:two-component system, response regulator PdtaR
MDKDEKQDRTRKGFELLYNVSRAISSDRYLEEILFLIVGMTAELMGSKICSLMILDEEKQELVIRATQSLSENYRSKPPVKVSESVSGRALLEKKPVVVRDVQQEPGYKYPDLARAENLKSLICVPLMIKNRAIGVLNCYTEFERDFTTEEMQVLMTVSNQAALAIENTKLLAEKVNAVEELETRKRVERAKGILMKRYKIDEHEAHRMLQKRSMEKRMPLKQVAEAVILSQDMKS